MTVPAWIPATALGIALAILGWRLATRWAARHLEQLIGDSLAHDWMGDLDDEYRALVDENA